MHACANNVQHVENLGNNINTYIKLNCNRLKYTAELFLLLYFRMFTKLQYLVVLPNIRTMISQYVNYI